MRLALRASLVLALLACAGCRRAPGDPIDPTNTNLAECPAGEPHLVVGLASAHADTDQALLRFTESLAPCRGAVLPQDELGTLSAVGALSDGTDLAGFSTYFSNGGVLARVDGESVVARIEDAQAMPIDIAAIDFEGRPAAAVVWGSRSSSTDSGSRLDIYAEDLTKLASFAISSNLFRVAPEPGGDASRIAGLVSGGLQVYRPELDALATTGELQVASPSTSGNLKDLHVRGDLVRAVGTKGVLSWRAGDAPAFLGPVQCRWPDTLGTPLPAESAEYVSAIVDPRNLDDTLVVVNGELEEGSDEISHIYALRPRGECRLVASIKREYRALSIAAP